MFIFNFILFYIESIIVAIAPTNTPSHCQHFNFSLNINAENIVVTIKLPTPITGYIKLGESVVVANNITNKFKMPLQTPAPIGIYQLSFNTSFDSLLSLLKYIYKHTKTDNPVAINIKKLPYSPL